MNKRNQLDTSIYMSTARIDSELSGRFVAQINDGLEEAPYYALDNPAVAVTLMDEYFFVADPKDEFQYKLGRAAARYLQGTKPPITDKIPGSLTNEEILNVVARRIARSINERRSETARQRGVQE